MISATGIGRLRAVAGLAAVIALSAATVHAEPAPPAPMAQRAEGEALCAYYKPVDPAAMSRVRALALTPGATFDVAALQKDPSLAEAFRQNAEQDRLRTAEDWAALCRYKAEDAAVRAKGRPHAVFLGVSITENWLYGDPSLFGDKVIDRGISGQTTPQILLRTYADVVSLHPDIVHILAGANDVAQNTGPTSDDDILNNVRAMLDIAAANHIKVVLASILPIAKVYWRPQVVDPAGHIVRLNAALRRLAAERGAIFVDYHAALTDGAGGMRAGLSNESAMAGGK